MLRRLTLLALLVTGAGIGAVGMSGPAAAAVTSSHITTPSDGTHYLVTDADPARTVTVSGTSDGAAGDLVDVRCYLNDYFALGVSSGVPVGSDGSFSTTMQTSRPYGTCVLRAVPHDLPYGASTTAFTGPRVTGERITSDKIGSGPNAGQTYDYYVLLQSSKAMNDYTSATSAGIIDSRLQYANGYSSSFLWYGNAALPDNERDSRSYLQVDGRDAYGPYAAARNLREVPGVPPLTFSASRNATTGTTTIRETDPIVVCPEGTSFPPTALSCPQLGSAGVRLERTMVADDGGRQIHVVDLWRSTDGRAHTVSAHYYQLVQGYQPQLGATDVGLKLPWLGTGYQTSITEDTFAGPSKAPASLFVRDDNAAPDGDTMSPRGAITVDVAPHEVHRYGNSEFTLRDEGIAVPAGGSRIVRQDFVIGTTESEIAAKAATSRVRLNPRRPDGLVRAGTSAYVGNGIYNATGSGQTMTLRKKRGRTATFDVQVQNDGTLSDTVTLLGGGAQKGFVVRYFAGTRDITTAVTHGTYALGLGPGQARVIRLVVKVRATATRGITRSWLVTSTSAHDSTSKDVVRANVTVRR